VALLLLARGGAEFWTERKQERRASRHAGCQGELGRALTRSTRSYVVDAGKQAGLYLCWKTGGPFPNAGPPEREASVPTYNLLDRRACAEAVGRAAAADSEAASVGLNETAGRSNVRQFREGQGSLREGSLGHRVAGSGGRRVLVKRGAPGKQPASQGIWSNCRSIAGPCGRDDFDHNGGGDGWSERVADERLHNGQGLQSVWRH